MGAARVYQRVWVWAWVRAWDNTQLEGGAWWATRRQNEVHMGRGGVSARVYKRVLDDRMVTCRSRYS